FYFVLGKWEDIISLFKEDHNKYNDYFHDVRYLWVRPSEENLQFINDQIHKQGCHRLISIGCGSGLLEWLLHQATGLDVIGTEVDRLWWESPYAPPKFLPLVYADETDNCNILFNEESALLFCYFNNPEAFTEYMKQYKGNCFVVIGPGEGRGTHTDPAPFDVQLQNWKLDKFQEVQHTKDFIAIYVKS
ncbi:hypothetical protein C0J52_21636, partial [Blattella germanica]